MQKCQNCGKEIRFIAAQGGVVVCECLPTVVYSEFGRRIEGYMVHKCGAVENERKTD